MSLQLVPPVVTEGEALTELRMEVRDFLAEQIADGRFTPHVDTWPTRWDRAFTQELARRGWLGMAIPTEYGGQDWAQVERFVVTEELLVVGAPLAAHWVAERHVVPSLLAHGTEDQKQALLPRIARGEVVFGIASSELESGANLPGIRTRGEQVAGGWRLTGTTPWPSGATDVDAFLALARSSPLDPADPSAGLSQLIVDLHAPGVYPRQGIHVGGDHRVTEVHLDGVLVPDDRVLGTIGAGWKQAMSEPGRARGGPERFLSTFQLLAVAAQAMMDGGLPMDHGLGRQVARVAALHQLSMADASALGTEATTDVSAAVVKVLGTTTEGDIADYVDLLTASGWIEDEELHSLLHRAIVQRPAFTLRGGTNEVLRGVIARGLGLR